MTLVDTSAWIEFFRRTGSPAHQALRTAIDAERVAVTEPVVMELLVGARDPADAAELQSILGGFPMMSVSGIESWEMAAQLHRACRRAGQIVRSQLDCVIAAVAIREGVPVLHADRDFDLIAQHTPLQVVPV